MAAAAGGSCERPADDITPADAGLAVHSTPLPTAGPVLSFLSPASALLGALQLDDPLASMSQADKDALSLAGAFCCSLMERVDQMGLLLGPCHRPRVQPVTAAQLWGPSAAETEAAGGDAAAAAAAAHTVRRHEEEEERILRPLKVSRELFLDDVQTGSSPSSSSPCLLTDLPVGLLHSICLSKTMCSPEGGRSLSLLSRTCTIFGKAANKGGLPLVSQLSRTFCKDGGVCRLPLTMGDFWCWPRMLSWLSQAVRVGQQHELKTINDGIWAARVSQRLIQAVRGRLLEGSMLVLVEPGVYEETVLIDEDTYDFPSVSIWACDRESETDNGEIQKVEWRSKDETTLEMHCNVSVSVNGMTMSAMKSEEWDEDEDDGENCVRAGAGATLSLERCNLTSNFTDNDIVNVSGRGTTAMLSGCCIHDSKMDGVSISGGAKATLLNNDIHSNANNGVFVLDKATQVVHLRNNRIHDMKQCGVSICNKANATLEDNTISDNDWTGVEITGQATATLTGNTIKGNGQCKIELLEKELDEMLGEPAKALYRGKGFPGVWVKNSTSMITMPPGSNTIEGNGKTDSTGEQVVVDRT